jgi:hypothetical protein
MTTVETNIVVPIEMVERGGYQHAKEMLVQKFSKDVREAVKDSMEIYKQEKDVVGDVVFTARLNTDNVVARLSGVPIPKPALGGLRPNLGGLRPNQVIVDELSGGLFASALDEFRQRVLGISPLIEPITGDVGGSIAKKLARDRINAALGKQGIPVPEGVSAEEVHTEVDTDGNMTTTVKYRGNLAKGGVIPDHKQTDNSEKYILALEAVQYFLENDNIDKAFDEIREALGR